MRFIFGWFGHLAPRLLPLAIAGALAACSATGTNTPTTVAVMNQPAAVQPPRPTAAAPRTYAPNATCAEQTKGWRTTAPSHSVPGPSQHTKAAPVAQITGFGTKIDPCWDDAEIELDRAAGYTVRRIPASSTWPGGLQIIVGAHLPSTWGYRPGQITNGGLIYVSATSTTTTFTLPSGPRHLRIDLLPADSATPRSDYAWQINIRLAR